ncbi:MAG: hypothetical protein IPH07_21100 [Deltaproteobacteria bacterium]|nr:hypothetical protein [Deltaproteobacteria bacterium]MBK8239810.1 hypothetical protein [Deltaproteobacteria bacterium]MBK8714546.1 hypothetical protein [Deltaproteobacteria bacterium]MBP7289425.1 hypothetical protein [Nannocystaceae bacterium]
MTDTQLHGIHPEPWPKDPGEALPDVSLPKQWPNDEPPAPEPEPEPEPDHASARTSVPAVTTA